MNNNNINSLYQIAAILMVTMSAAASGSATPIHNKIGNKINIKNIIKHNDENKKELFFSLFAFGITILTIGIIFIAAGFIYHYIYEDKTLTDLQIDNKFILWMILTGLILGTSSSLLRYINLKIKNLTINIILYFGPLITLLVLYYLNYINVVNNNYLIIGSIIIVLSNILIHITERNNNK